MKPRKFVNQVATYLIAAILASVLVLPGLAHGARPEPRSNGYLVLLKPGQDIRSITAKHDLDIEEELPEEQTYLLQSKKGGKKADPAMLTALRRESGVEAADPNLVLTIPYAQAGTPVLDGAGTPLLDHIGQPGTRPVALPDLTPATRAQVERMYQQWRGQRAFDLVGVARANERATGRGVTVAFLDGGVEQRHLLFSWLWSQERSAGGHHGGWEKEIDLVPESEGPPDTGHGTFIAGVIAGVAPGATLLSVRVANSNGEAPLIRIASGIRKAVNRGADIINLSMSTPDDGAETLRRTIEWAEKRGAVVVASAGNRGAAGADYPGRLTFAVGATTNKDRRADFSNYGRDVDLAAPGAEIYSPFVADGRPVMATWSGTSFSAAIASGAAALVKEADRGASPQEIPRKLQETSTRLSGSTGFEAGRLDLVRALRNQGQDGRSHR